MLSISCSEVLYFVTKLAFSDGLSFSQYWNFNFLIFACPLFAPIIGEIETLKHIIVHCHRNNQDSIYEFFSLRILAGEKHPQIRLQHLIRKVWIWVVCTSNQPFKTDSYNERKFLKKWSSYWKNPVVCDRFILYSPFYFSYTGF